ncbi:hypothetical protein [Microbacterium sp. NPDC087868]|uniref:hypothetical protein n=1 Tax=Microbacterium sp. NPDC087868 TaxID=3364195 RepID=UPI00384C8AFD
MDHPDGVRFGALLASLALATLTLSACVDASERPVPSVTATSDASVSDETLTFDHGQGLAPDLIFRVHSASLAPSEGADFTYTDSDGQGCRVVLEQMDREFSEGDDRSATQSILEARGMGAGAELETVRYVYDPAGLGALQSIEFLGFRESGSNIARFTSARAIVATDDLLLVTFECPTATALDSYIEEIGHEVRVSVVSTER